MTRRRRPAPLLLLIIAAAVVLIAGCATPIERAYTSRVVFNTALEDLIAARQAGMIPDAQYTAAYQLAEAVTPILDEMDRAAVDGNPVAFWKVYQAARAKIREFLIAVAQSRAQARAQAHTT